MTRRTLRIAIYVADLDVRGGTHKQVLKLAQYLKTIGHEVTIFTPCYTQEKTYSEFSALNIIHLRKSSNDHLLTSKLYGRLIDQFRLFLKSRDYEIINAHDNRTKFYIILNSVFGKAKLVWQLNDIDPAFGITDKGKLSFIRQTISKPLNRLFAKVAAYSVDKITVNVSKNKARVNQYLNQNSEVIFCGVDFLEPRTTTPIILDKIQIVSTGVLVRYRNYESLIAAAEIINQSGKGVVSLTIVGETRYDLAYLNELKLLASKLRVDVNFAGSVSQQELNQYYEKAHVFAFINVDQSWGLSVFEAASMGLPVVLSNSVGAVELLEDKPGIFIIDPLSPKEIAQAVEKVLNNQDDYKGYCAQVVETVNNMSWDKMYSKNIESIFFNLLQRN